MKYTCDLCVVTDDDVKCSLDMGQKDHDHPTHCVICSQEANWKEVHEDGEPDH